MASATPNNSGATTSSQNEENPWARMPPLHTIKPEEIIRYQIVDWDRNNPHHPRYLAGCVLLRSLFRRDYYYWVGCSSPLPKEDGKKDPPAIYFNSPTTSSSAAFSSTRSLPSSQNQAENDASVSTEANKENQNPNLYSRAETNNNHDHPTVPSQSRGTFAPTHPQTSSSSIDSPSTAPSVSLSPPSSKLKRVLHSEQQEGRNIRRYDRASMKSCGRQAGTGPSVEAYHN
ncbi:uncharacterized protein RAG0_02612 [Rhynchosporium agropyri]|uniref:Uncharacterized protein n=1 Tax=Rhynchosporium agropyri TaxID=914238 RepID=A0A1E1K1U2_9HELO|nr:uncharacterized protein RAG0_02612 [Rhynchosporium agropyri]